MVTLQNLPKVDKTEKILVSDRCSYIHMTLFCVWFGLLSYIRVLFSQNAFIFYVCSLFKSAELLTTSDFYCMCSFNLNGEICFSCKL